MALPSRPNVRVGLPSSPSPRSRSLSARSPQDPLPSRSSSAAGDRSNLHNRSTSTPLPSGRPQPVLRPQRSLISLPSQVRMRMDAIPPMPPLPLTQPQPDVAELYKKNNGSDASLSSASSDDTVFTNPWEEPLSSATSVESKVEIKEVTERVVIKPEPGFGSSLWHRVAAVAGTLTVSVSRALEHNIVTNSGEVTPAGEESRLTRGLKAYHIAKAREPSDLPEWLFNERERGVKNVIARSAEDTLADAVKPTSEVPLEPPPRYADISRTASPAPSSASRNILKKDPDAEATETMSRGTQRLKELREAKKRTPTIRFAESVHPRHVAGDGARATDVRPSAGRYAFPAASGSAPPMPTIARPVTPLRTVGRRPNAVGLPTSVRPRRV